MPDEQFKERTRDFWQRRTSRQLTDEDAREMIANVAGFFRLLAEWDRITRAEEEPPPTDGHATGT
jgi:hypothetical protein